MLMLLISSFGVAVSFNLLFYVTREVSGERLINLFTDTAAILNEFDLRSIIGCPGGMSTFRLYFRALFGTFFLKVFLE